MGQTANNFQFLLEHFEEEGFHCYDYGHYEAIRAHLDKYFHLALNFLNEKDYSLAVFFAVTLLEECGKLVLISHTDINDLAIVFKAGFQKHSEKYLIALWTAMWHSLAQEDLAQAMDKDDHTYPNAHEEEIAHRLLEEAPNLFKLKKVKALFEARNTGLYLDFDRAALAFKIPNEVLSGAEAYSILCSVADIYAIIQPIYCGPFQGFECKDDQRYTQGILQSIQELRAQSQKHQG